MNLHLLLLTIFLYGLKHGVDWDHLAAITDITGSSTAVRTNFLKAFLYIAGHAAALLFFGILILLLGLRIPASLDFLMDKLVGITLIALGIWVIFSIQKNGQKSRGVVLLNGLTSFRNFITQKLLGKKISKTNKPLSVRGLGSKTAFSIGVIHGIGAETPTQAILFITAAGAKNHSEGLLLLMVFIFGLIISNTLITLTTIFGYKSILKNERVFKFVGGISGLISILVGVLFVTGNTALLPLF